MQNPRLSRLLAQWSEEDVEQLYSDLKQDTWHSRVYGPELRWRMLAAASAERRRRALIAQDHPELPLEY